jgi:hypothetical protein
MTFYKIISNKYTPEIFKTFKKYIEEINPKINISEKDIINPKLLPYKNNTQNIGYIYIENNTPIGYCFISFFENNYKYLHSIHILPSFKNKYHKMIQEVINDVGKGILVKVDKKEINTYKKIGFTEILNQKNKYTELFIYEDLKAYYSESENIEKSKFIINEFNKRNILLIDNWDNADIIWKVTLKNINPTLMKDKLINNFKNIYLFSSKDKLITTFSNNKKYFPISINIQINNNLKELFQSINNKKELQTKNKAFQENIWILKPVGLFGGQGIFLIKDEIPKVQNGNYILQRYIDSPMLYNDRKFDIRQFILITSDKNGIVSVYKFNKFYCRLSTKKYSTVNIKDKYVHITNESIQKDNIENTELIAPMDIINTKIQNKIHKMLLYISKVIKEKINPEKLNNCFSLLGIDIMIDAYENPYLIEMNLNPGLTKRSIHQPFEEIISDTFKLTVDKYFNIPNDGITQFIKLI